ncbi:tetratricopeptide repeat protein [candidate division KSB1 bacterium]
MKYFFCFIISILCSFKFTVNNNDYIDKGLRFTFQAEYDKSNEYWENLLLTEKKPAIFFYKLYNSYIELIDTEDYYNSDEFVKSCDSLINFNNSSNNVSADQNLIFFIASLHTFKAGIYSKKKNHFKAYSSARKGNSLAEKALEISPDFSNACLINGAYNYWKHKLIDSLPLIKKDFSNDIRIIKKSLNGDKYVRYLAMHQLAWIYYLNKDFETSIEFCNRGLNEFKDSRLFLKPLAENYKKTGKYSECLEIYEKLTDSYKKCDYENKYINVKYSIKIAELNKYLSRNSETLKYVKYVNNLELNEIERNASKDYLRRCRNLSDSSRR